MIIAGVVALAGLLLTVVTLPEPRGKSLEELSEYAYAEELQRVGRCSRRWGPRHELKQRWTNSPEVVRAAWPAFMTFRGGEAANEPFGAVPIAAQSK